MFKLKNVKRGHLIGVLAAGTILNLALTAASFSADEPFAGQTVQKESVAGTEVSSVIENSAAPPALAPVEFWNRQNFEQRKTKELSDLLDKILGPHKAAVFIQYEWPDGPGAAAAEPLRAAVTVLLNPSVSSAELAFIQDLAARVVGLDGARGDQVEVFRVAAKNSIREILFSPERIVDLIKFFVTVLLVLMGFVVLSRVSGQISASLDRVATTTRTHDIDLTLAPKIDPRLESSKSQARIAAVSAPAASGERGDLGMRSMPVRSGPWGAGGAEPAAAGPRPESAAPEAPEGLIRGSGAWGAGLDPQTLAGALEDESSRSIALFISTLDSETGGRALSYLPPSKQEEVALTLSQMETEPDARELAQVQARIHLKARKALFAKKTV